MKELLEKFCEKKEFVSIYRNSEDSLKFYFGRILCVNDEKFAFSLVTPGGAYDGVMVLQIDDILQLETDERYKDKVSTLAGEDGLPVFDGNIDGEHIIESVLRIAKQDEKLVAIELCDSGYDDVVGFFEELNNGICKIRKIDSDGFESGYSWFPLDRITKVDYDSVIEQRTRKLWLSNQSHNFYPPKML